MNRMLLALLSCGLLVTPPDTSAEDYFLTIGGGYSPSGNQVSLEKNVLLFQRTLRDLEIKCAANDVYFADGDSPIHDVQVMDRDAVPKANRLMAEFFGSDENLGLSYRDHLVPDVRGAANPQNIRRWFDEVGSRMQAGDRLIVYVTAHGNRSKDRRNPYDTSIATWDRTSIKATAFVELLDMLPAGVEVVAVMVQCYTGGFARFLFNEGDPDKGLSRQRRFGFYATVHDRPAAGCTADVDEADYAEYSTYFWAALSGRDRLGKAIATPDYNGDGSVSFDEAHAYTILNADTIDLPVKTSGEFLSVHSKFGDDDSELLKNDEPYEVILNLAAPAEKAVLEGLSEQLELTGSNRVAAAWRETQPRRGRGRTRGRRVEDAAGPLRLRISSDVKQRWPELANLLNPVSVALLTSRSDEFIDAIESHPDYERYREQTNQSRSTPDAQERNVKFERFLSAADHVILAENLRRMGDDEKLAQYRSIVQAESSSLRASPAVSRP